MDITKDITVPEKPPANLTKVKGKWYAQITVPEEHREALRGQKQLRASTGTSDRKEAERRLHDTAQKLYDRLPNPIAELKARIGGLDQPDWLPDPDDEREMQIWQNQKDEIAQKFTVLGELKEELQTMKAEHNGSSLKIRELADLWLGTGPYELKKTLKEAQTAVEQFITDNGNLPINDIEPTTGYGWAEKLGTKLANKSVKKKIGYVSAVLQWGITRGHLKANPLANLKLSKIGKMVESYIPFTREEIRQILAQQMPDDHRLLLQILVSTGMRLDEAALLNWEDIQEEDGIMFFNITGTDKRVKNIGSRRKVPVPTELLHQMTVLRDVGPVFPGFNV